MTQIFAKVIKEQEVITYKITDWYTSTSVKPSKRKFKLNSLVNIDEKDQANIRIVSRLELMRLVHVNEAKLYLPKELVHGEVYELKNGKITSLKDRTVVGTF